MPDSGKITGLRRGPAGIRSDGNFQGNDPGEHGVNEKNSDAFAVARTAVMTLLRSRGRKARFASELFALLLQKNIAREDVEQVLAELEGEGAVMIRDHFCADPHLAGVDLRVIALMQGAEPQLEAIREIDTAWNRWLADYLANHRCG